MKYYEVVVTATSVCLIQAETEAEALDLAFNCDIWNDLDARLEGELTDEQQIQTVRRHADYISEEK